MKNYKELIKDFTPEQRKEYDSIIASHSRMGFRPDDAEMQELVEGIIKENWEAVETAVVAQHGGGESESGGEKSVSPKTKNGGAMAVVAIAVESSGEDESESEAKNGRKRKSKNNSGDGESESDSQSETGDGTESNGGGSNDQGGESESQQQGSTNSGKKGKSSDDKGNGGEGEADNQGDQTGNNKSGEGQGKESENNMGENDKNEKQKQQHQQAQQKQQEKNDEKKKEKPENKVIGLHREKAAIKAALKARQNVLLIGETGTGKTRAVKMVAKELNQELVRINLDGGTSSDQLIGRFQVRSTPTGPETFFQEGPLVRAMRQGKIVLFDEINAALADVLFTLHAVLEDESRLFISETDEEIIPHDDFRILATMNPTGDYAGTRTLNHALYSRFGCVIRFETPNGSDVLKILKSRFPAAVENHLLNITQVYQELMVAVKSEKINTRISLRECIAAASLCDQLGLKEAINVAMLEKLELDERKEIGALGQNHIASNHSIEEMLKAVDIYKTAVDENEKLKKELLSLQDLKDIAKKFAQKVGV